ncbi:hypothetical protein LTR78_000588 [Recurvomyces mirabilis]|uniref:Peroxin 11C n=1 Tax=Recurvomyces mirabilis TaxID=574656 RepID=A0AAE1C6L0_9PEZI|nr:hypothetical protein LTR78_000588 [Recurvomyces mirabilis]KAK5162242.1 hypothetical protein LTS14_000589 [Recurvomyces mirabilis]
MASKTNRSLLNVLTRAGRRSDAFLTHLNRVLASSAGVEAVLCTLCYTLYFVYARLLRLLERRYERVALALASKASSSMLPSETVVATLEPPKSYLSETCGGIKALADLTDDFRFFTRLGGLVTIYSWARDNYIKPPGDAILKSLVWCQVLMSTIFQVLENGAYLASKGVLRGEKWERRQPKWWVWSNRFWLMHVGLEALRLLRVRQLRYNEDFGAKATDTDDGRVTTQSVALKKKWKADFYANAGWFPLTLQSSFEDQTHGPLSETWIGLFGMIPGIVALKDVWEQTRV